jgi:2-polyprenyl-3-methyl-5-hydroxy-6-metoxy-1,4-benzoquinol methylase
MGVLPHNSKIYDRRSLICHAVEGKKVLHIGCTDTPFTEERLRGKNLLHQELQSYVSHLSGLDVDEKAISIMEKYGIKNLYAYSIYELSEFNKEKINHNFDYIVMTEVLEHLSNPGSALVEISKYIRRNNKNTELIITVPNIHSYFSNFSDPFLNREVVHPDHLCYYSYSTLRRLLESTGFEIQDIRYVTYGLGRFSYPIAFFLNLFSSSFLPSIYVLVKLAKKSKAS